MSQIRSTGAYGHHVHAHVRKYLFVCIRTTHDAMLHSALWCCAPGLERIQHSVHNKSLALKCTEHSVLSKYRALSTQCPSPFRHSVLSASIVWSHVPVSPADLPGSLGLGKSLRVSPSLSESHLGLEHPGRDFGPRRPVVQSPSVRSHNVIGRTGP